jgi:hypothetical protein
VEVEVQLMGRGAVVLLLVDLEVEVIRVVTHHMLEVVLELLTQDQVVVVVIHLGQQVAVRVGLDWLLSDINTKTRDKL